MSPTVIAHYRVVRRVGAGGMGEVFLAEDTKLDRPVALKLLREELARDASRRKRFHAEAKAASALNHSHVCTIYEVGETPEGQPFIAMEYLEGQGLDALARHRRLELHEIVSIAVQVADALEAARQHHVVHRDIKPGNIIVNAQGRAKVLDFGLAKRLDLPAEASNVTQEGAIVGTPNYLSPELALGREVDTRSDIFSLGVVLYELAAGQNPFAGKVFGETVNNIINRDPPPLAPWNPTVTPEFERIVRKCLEKDPARRYGTPGKLLEDLVRLQGTLGTGRLKKRTLLAMASSLVILAAVGFTVAALSYKAKPTAEGFARDSSQITSAGNGPTTRVVDQAPPKGDAAFEKSVAVLSFEIISADEGDRYISDGFTEEVQIALRKLRDLRALAFKGEADDIRKLAEKLKVGAVLQGSVRKVGDRLRVSGHMTRVADGCVLWTDEYDGEVTELFDIQVKVASAVAQALAGPLPAHAVQQLTKRPTDNPEAYLLYLKGRFVWSARSDPTNAWDAAKYFEKALTKDTNYALAYAGLADCWISAANGLNPQYRYPQAEKWARAALKLDKDIAAAHVTLASARAWYHYDWDGAFEEFEKAIELDPKYATAHQWYANALRIKRRFAEASSQIRLAWECDPLSPIIAATVPGYLALVEGQGELAIQMMQQQIRENPGYGQAQSRLIEIYMGQKMWTEALDMLETAENGHPDEKSSSVSRAVVYAAMGRTNDARAILEKLLELRKEGKAKALGLAEVYHALGEDEAAVKMLEQAHHEEKAPAGLTAINWKPFWKSLREHEGVKRILGDLNLLEREPPAIPGIPQSGN